MSQVDYHPHNSSHLCYHLFCEKNANQKTEQKNQERNIFYWNEELSRELILSNYSKLVKKFSDEAYFPSFVKKFWYFFVLHQKGGTWLSHRKYISKVNPQLNLSPEKSYLSKKTNERSIWINQREPSTPSDTAPIIPKPIISTPIIPKQITPLGTILIKVKKNDALLEKAIQVILAEPKIFTEENGLSDFIISYIVSKNPKAYEYFNYWELPTKALIGKFGKGRFGKGRFGTFFNSLGILRRDLLNEIKSRAVFLDNPTNTLNKYLKKPALVRSFTGDYKAYDFLQRGKTMLKFPIKVPRPSMSKSMPENDLEQGSNPATNAAIEASESYPLISCLMVTFSRKIELAKEAIACFKEQTYPNLELVLLEQEGNEIYNWTLKQKINNVKYRFFKKSETLGKLRNLSMEEARGDYLCLWDDDDLSDPKRLEIQYHHLKRTNSSGSFLARQTVEYKSADPGNSFIKAYNSYRIWENTMLIKKDSSIKYPELPRGEDTAFVSDYVSKHQVVLIDRPELYTYRIHGSNTFSHEHFNKIWRNITAIERLTF